MKWTPKLINIEEKEIEALNRKLADLSEDELKQVAGGLNPHRREWPEDPVNN